MNSTRASEAGSSLDSARSYARAHTRSTRPRSSTTTTSPEGGGTTTKRWDAEDWRQRLDSAPRPALSFPDAELLLQLVAEYTQITGDPVRRQGKADLIGYCYTIHGDDLGTVIRRIYSATGTATNLLGIVRTTPPDQVPEATLLVVEPAPEPPRREAPGETIDPNYPFGGLDSREALEIVGSLGGPIAPCPDAATYREHQLDVRIVNGRAVCDRGCAA
jgi:hypothetical protein